MNQYFVNVKFTREFNLAEWAEAMLKRLGDPSSEQWSFEQWSFEQWSFIHLILDNMAEYPLEVIKETQNFAVIGPTDLNVDGARSWKKLGDILVPNAPVEYMRMELKKTDLILNEDTTDMYLDTAIEKFQWSKEGYSVPTGNIFGLDTMPSLDEIKQQKMILVGSGGKIKDVEDYFEVAERAAQSTATIVERSNK